MGFFKDIGKLNKIGKEASANWDVGAQMAHAQASMAQASAAMAMAGQRVGGMAAATGTPSTATITAVTNTGMLMNHSPMLQLELLVMFRGVPVPVSLSEVVQLHHLAKAQRGASLTVKVGDTPQDLWIDWENS